ncbi:MAG TPA: hypothetical protein VFA86_03235 [Gammaproteobacteria bacterium]|nr:hypothetical protein [Gammaproteobacteria bacterium]
MAEETGSGFGVIEGVLGAGALALGIIGLAGVHPAFLAAIATILVGIMFLLEGNAIVRRVRQMLPEDAAPAGNGLTVQTGAGAAGIVLGILALLQVDPVILTAAAVIAFGAAFVLTASNAVQSAEAGVEQSNAGPETKRAARQLAGATAGGGVFLGAGNIVLGILAVALIGTAVAGAHHPVSAVLVLVALLATGGAALLSGSAGQRLFASMGL